MPEPSTALTQYRLHHNSLYDPAYCKEMLMYFINTTTTVMQKFEESFEEEQLAPGVTKKKVKGTMRAVTGVIPTFGRFANSIGVSAATLRDWALKHPDFGYAYERCKDVMKDFLIQGSANGSIPPQTAIFLMKCLTDMRDDDSALAVNVAPTAEKPALADYTPAELQAMREALDKCEVMGLKLILEEPVKEAAAEGAEADEHKG